MIRYLSKLSILLLLSLSANADMRDDFPSCTAAIGANAQDANLPPSQELFVIIDQTLNPTVEIKRSVHQQVHAFLKPGDRLTLIRFSAYLGNNYTDIVLSGTTDKLLTKDIRHGTSKKLLKRFDACISKQKAYVKKTVDQKLVETFGKEDQDIPKTELVGNLSTLSEVISQSSASRKVVLLFSDMLENSDISSFYHRGGLRKINPENELNKYRQNNLLGNWDNADIYVMGAGLLPASHSSTYRSESVKRPIRRFWEQYFSQSNSKLSGWGQPALLSQIR